MSKRKVVDVIDLATTSSDDEEHPTAGSQQPPQPRPPAKGSVQARSNGRQTVLSDVCRRGGSKAQPSGGQPSAEAPSQKEPESSKGRKASSEEGYASKKARTGSDSSKGALPVAKAPLALIVSQKPAGAGSSQPHLPDHHLGSQQQPGSQESAGSGGGGSQEGAGRHAPVNHLHNWLHSRGKQQRSVAPAHNNASWLPASTQHVVELTGAAAEEGGVPPPASQAGPKDGSRVATRPGAHGSSQGGGGGPGRSEPLWCEKHRPPRSEDLVVHKKKVAELRSWMEAHLPAVQRPGIPRVLLVTGPSGCGKSTAVRVLASELGYELVEWTPPAPTLWSELLQQGLQGSGYVSKMDAFEAFVSRIKYPALGVTSSAATTQPAASQPPAGPRPRLVVLDDLPHVHSHESRQQLAQVLQDMVRGARCPVVMITTEESGGSMSVGFQGGGDGGTNMATGSYKGLHKGILAALESAGAGIVSFNPITTANAAKALLRVAELESRPLSTAAAAALAEQAEGDLRNAVQSLQLMSGCAEVPPPAAPAAQGRGGGRKSAAAGAGRGGGRGRSKAGGAAGGGRTLLPHEASRLGVIQRDQGLELFHALGKFLYNKRDGVIQAEEEAEEPAGDGAAGGGPSAGASGAAVKDNTRGSAALVSQHLQPSGSSGGGSGTQVQAAGGWRCDFSYTEGMLLPHLRRPPMRYDPERILVQSGLEPLPVTAFLHANYLGFIDESAVGDMSMAATYLSDAAFMACYRTGPRGYQGHWGGGEDTTGATATLACAGSVATRGLLFANNHPAPRKFTALQGPQVEVVGKAWCANREALQEAALRMAAMHGTLPGGGDSAAMAVQLLPWMRALAASHEYVDLQACLPDRWTSVWQGHLREQRAGALAAHASHHTSDSEQLTQMLQSASLSVDDPIEALY